MCDISNLQLWFYIVVIQSPAHVWYLKPAVVILYCGYSISCTYAISQTYSCDFILWLFNLLHMSNISNLQLWFYIVAIQSHAHVLYLKPAVVILYCGYSISCTCAISQTCRCDFIFGYSISCTCAISQTCSCDFILWLFNLLHMCNISNLLTRVLWGFYSIEA